MAISNVYLDQITLLYCRCYTAEYPYGITKFGDSTILFDPLVSSQKRQELLDKYAIDYIITINPLEEKIFSDHPDVFTEVFENDFQYQVESTKKGIYPKQVNLKIYKYNIEEI